MARSLKLQMVERARGLIADESHWCGGDLARDANGMGVCPMSDPLVLLNQFELSLWVVGL